MQRVRSFTSSVLEPRARGVEFGEHHRAEIASTLAAYDRLFVACSTEPFDLDLWADRAWRSICQLAPVAAEEISGMSTGSGAPVRALAALNSRTELLAIANPTGMDECSSVVSLADGQAPIAVQTWDWYDAMAANWLHWQISYPDGRVISTVTEYGVLAKIGVNAHGVGVLFNMLHHSTDADQPLGYPLHLLSRHILETSCDVADAVASARAVQVSASSSLTVLDSAGEAVSIELFPGGLGLVQPENGLLARTNHFLSAEGQTGCLASTLGPGSRIRRDTLLSAFEAGAPRSTEEITEVLDDHADVGGICAHPDEAMERALQHATLATIAIDPDRCTLEVADGGPCTRQSREADRTARATTSSRT